VLTEARGPPTKSVRVSRPLRPQRACAAGCVRKHSCSSAQLLNAVHSILGVAHSLWSCRNAVDFATKVNTAVASN
jgi:hypothetical protein